MSIVDRMREARNAACFSVSEMALWFGVGRTVMSTWIVRNHEPRSYKIRQLEPLLQKLENALRHKQGLLPVPLHIKQYDRKAYIEKVQGDAAGRVSKTCSAKRR